MKLIIGLGNHGKEYSNTRHNAGYMAIDHFANANNLTWKDGYLGKYIKTQIHQTQVVLYKPELFMNLSGMGTFQIMNYFQISAVDIIVIYDDINFSIGDYRLKISGTSGGHKGIQNIIDVLNTKNFARIKIGIDKPNIPIVKYVLSNFKPNDLAVLQNLFLNLQKVIDLFIITPSDSLIKKCNVLKNKSQK